MNTEALQKTQEAVRKLQDSLGNNWDRRRRNWTVPRPTVTHLSNNSNANYIGALSYRGSDQDVETYLNGERLTLRVCVYDQNGSLVYNGWCYPTVAKQFHEYCGEHLQAYTEHLQTMCGWLGEPEIARSPDGSATVSLRFNRGTMVDGVAAAQLLYTQLTSFTPPPEPVNYETGMPIEIPVDW